MNLLGGFVAVVAIFGMSSPVLEVDASAVNKDLLFLQGCRTGTTYYPDPNYCTKFFECVDGVPVKKDCPDGTVFSDTLGLCVRPGSEWDTCTPAHADRECNRNPALLIPHPTRCQGYFNCSDYVPYSLGNIVWSNGYEKECPYPKLFDTRLKKCVGYQNVVCGKGRVEAKWKCDYYAEQCQTAMCRPCWVDNPSCVGKTNGLWPVPYAIWSPYYIECEDERDLKGRLVCPDGEKFDPEERKCVRGHLIKAMQLVKET